jgi:hypothetical protein
MMAGSLRDEEGASLPPICFCRDDERAAVASIINRAADAYRGIVPADRWHELYISAGELDRDAHAPSPCRAQGARICRD